MTSRERILAAYSGLPVDHVPLTTWSFGLNPPPRLRWKTAGRDVPHWFSMRLEHIHTLPHPWTLEDDFKRVEAWSSLGIDDILEVSIPWTADPRVTWRDARVPAGKMDACPIVIREYETPAGPVKHAIRLTSEKLGPGWVIQPDTAWLFEDLNIPRAVRHAVTIPEDAAAAEYLYQGPDKAAREWLAGRMAKVHEFAARRGIAVQAWSAFGMDAIVWMAGAQGAVMLALDHPKEFEKLVEAVLKTDLERTELAAAHPGVDIIAERGWYSSTDFWSPKLFDRFVFPHIKEMSALVHRYGKRFVYVMTTGVEILGDRLADAGVDVLYFFDPVQDRVTMDTGRRLARRMTLVGGGNSMTLREKDPRRITEQVRTAVDALAPSKRFVLHPVDALYPDTPWAGIETFIKAWKECAWT